jgi:hypothetical protein
MLVVAVGEKSFLHYGNDRSQTAVTAKEFDCLLGGQAKGGHQHPDNFVSACVAQMRNQSLCTLALNGKLPDQGGSSATWDYSCLRPDCRPVIACDLRDLCQPGMSERALLKEKHALFPLQLLIATSKGGKQCPHSSAITNGLRLIFLGQVEEAAHDLA